MKLLSLFSGIGAFEKALTNLGIDYELVGFSEIDKWAIESYSAIHDVSTDLNLGDVSEIEIEDIPETDIVTYGFPCQDVSVAGKQKGISCGTRSGLLFEAERIIDGKKPKFAIAENVKNLVGKRHREDFEALLERLDSYGYNNYWKVLNAKDFGIPQNRERVFIVSIRKDIVNETFEFPKPLELRVRLRDLLDDTVEDKYFVDNKLLSDLICREGNIETPSIVASRGRNKDNPSDRTPGNEVHQRLELNSQGMSNTLTTIQKDNLVLVGRLDMKGHDQLKRVYNPIGISPTLTTMGGGNTEPKVLVKEATKKGYDIATEEDSINISFPNSKTRRGRVGKGVAQTLDTQCNQAVLQDYKIRKLTPLECWRLMGFEDEDYWKARRRLEEVFYNGNDRSNSQMYKQAGNSIVVNVLEGIFKELFKLEEE